MYIVEILESESRSKYNNLLSYHNFVSFISAFKIYARIAFKSNT